MNFAGKLAVAFLVLTALLGAFGLWWTATRLGYGDPEEILAVGLTTPEGAVSIPASGTTIGRDTSPRSYRSCFTLAQPAPKAVPAPGAVPTVAPSWYECFDAEAIGADLAAGRAAAVLGTRDVRYGIDRLVALYPDGRGFAWDEINECGEVVFDGRPTPEGCAPPPPEDG
ncbi:hypothetical protein BCF33_0079 [Hasllibacter halocynthiae]|uniref:Histidine kinase n=1 Tax=Hasllibacter halocynthiae TaxID=595589 RepID=A0A2T0X6B6_9RHOB|nr:DUF6446 family protein [Hasllibacter halocynthiae]PRY94488.1 hypothetical protein BCF33_0079 [Hasllibacter halocynthiae]